MKLQAFSYKLQTKQRVLQFNKISKITGENTVNGYHFWTEVY